MLEELSSAMMQPEEWEKPTPKSASDKLPKGAKTLEQRKKLAKRVGDAIRQGIEDKGELHQRIRLNEQFVQNKNVRPARLPWKNAQHFHIPLAGPKLMARKANVVGTVTAQDPVFRISNLGAITQNDKIENVVQFFLDIVGWKETFDEAVELAMITNCPIWRVTFQEYPNGYHCAAHTGPFAGVVYDIIHPDYFVCYPANAGGIPQSRVCGHCYDIRKAVIAEKQSKGDFLNDVTIKGCDKSVYEMHGSTNKEEELSQPNQNNGEEGDKNIVLWDVIWRDNLDKTGEKLYRVILRKDDGEDVILLLEPYTLPFHWYVDMPIKREWGKFWTEGSPANDVQGLQILLNTLVNEFVWGVQMASRPPILTENWQYDGSIVGYQPGEYRNVRNLGKAMPVPVAFNPAGFDYLITLVRQFSDSVTKTSDALTGAPSNSREATATEQNIKYQAFQIGSTDDIASITPSLRRLIMVTLETLYENFESWYSVYGEALGVDNKDILRKSYSIELSGKSPADSPQLQSQQAQMLLQLAGAFPQSGIPLNELIKSIVTATTLPNKEDILRQIDEISQQQEMPNVGPDDLAAMLQGQGEQGNVDMGTLLGISSMGGGNPLFGEPGGGGEGSVPSDVSGYTG